MWDIKYVQPFGLPTKRNLLLFITTLLVTLFSYLLLTATPVQAAPSDVKWEQGGLIYEGNKYGGPADNKSDYKLPDGSVLYVFIEKTGVLQDEKLHVLYFPSSPAAGQKTVQYTVYGMNSTGKLSDGSTPKTLTVDSSTTGEAGEPLNPDSSSCKVDGIGWIVCSATNFLAIGMDWVFNVIAGFVAVRPLSVANDSVMHRVWEIMRNFANVAFVIAFLFIIYSQLTSVGLSNYGIKKILPRVIIAAILVNVSYWICVVAIDLSNILGYSLQEVFISFRELVTEGGSNSWQLTSWESVTSFILAGGAAAGMTIVGITSASAAMGAFSVVGVALLLVPILMGAFITVMVVLFILAARQAIITLLVIISPLALVAYLLPNTEKWFEKWRGLFMTMLIFFPAFSLVFGGAQFAGLLIIQNADDINTVLLGMAVQIAPLAITPLLLKLSGTLLSRVAGIINDPSKGIKDRTKNWSKDRLAARAANENAKTRDMAQNGTLGGRHFVRRTALGIDTRRRLREGQKAVNETRATSLFNDSKAGSALNTAEREAEREKTTIQNKLETTWNVKAKIDPQSLEKELKLRVSTDEATLAKNKLETMYEEAKAGNRPDGFGEYGPLIQSRAELLNRARDTSTHLALEGMKKKAAENRIQDNTTQALLADEQSDLRFDGLTARTYAGGIRGQEGADTALAAAVAHERKEFNDQSGEKAQLIKHFNLSSSERQSLATGADVSATKNGITYTFKHDDEYAVDAAIEEQMKTGSEEQIREIIMESGRKVQSDGNVIEGKTYKHRTTISEAIGKNGIPGKALMFGNKTIDNVAKGEFYGEESIENAAFYNVNAGKVRDDVLAVQGTASLKVLYGLGEKPTHIAAYRSLDERGKAAYAANYQALKRSATKILLDDVNRNASEAARKIFEDNKIPQDELPEDKTEA